MKYSRKKLSNLVQAQCWLFQPSLSCSYVLAVRHGSKQPRREVHLLKALRYVVVVMVKYYDMN